MRYAILSDIHANLTALQSVLSDIARHSVDKIICLGDTMGYGPQPAETLELVYQVAECHLLGNHDAAVCGKLNPIIFCPTARKAVVRHRELISGKAIKWLNSMPLSLKTPSFRCAHGDFSKPGAFRYIINAKDALPSFQTVSEQLLFIGHTHLPSIYVIGESGTPHFLGPMDFILEENKRYIVNPGSVGYPRTGRIESTYCIFDSDERSIVFHHLPFDHRAFNNALRLAGLDEMTWQQSTPEPLSLPEVRERLSFTRPLDDKLHLTETIRQIQSSHRAQIKKYRVLIILSVALLIASSLYFILFRAPEVIVDSPILTVPAEPLLLSPSPSASQIINKNYLHPLPTEFQINEAIEGWRYTLSERNQQQVTAMQYGIYRSLIITNQSPQQFVLESPLIKLERPDLKKLHSSGRIRKLENYNGTVAYELQSYAEQPDGEMRDVDLISYTVKDSRKKDSNVAEINRQFILKHNPTHFRFRVKSRFNGTLEIFQPCLSDIDSTFPAIDEMEGNIP